jgi:hypothetical protein
MDWPDLKSDPTVYHAKIVIVYLGSFVLKAINFIVDFQTKSLIGKHHSIMFFFFSWLGSDREPDPE